MNVIIETDTYISRRTNFSQAEIAVFDWLKHRSVPHILGDRSAWFSYNNTGFIGVFEDKQRAFARRFHYENGRYMETRLGIHTETPAQRLWMREMYTAIRSLDEKRVIQPIPTPRALMGIGTFYELAR